MNDEGSSKVYTYVVTWLCINFYEYDLVLLLHRCKSVCNNYLCMGKNYYMHGLSDIMVTITLPDDVTKHDITCIIDAKHLVVGLTDGTTYIRDDLYGIIDPTASNWIIKRHR